MLDIQIPDTLVMVICGLIIYRNLKIGYHCGFINGGMNIFCIFLNFIFTRYLIVNNIINFEFLKSLSQYIQNYLILFSYDTCYLIVKWIFGFIVTSIPIAIIQKYLILPSMSKIKRINYFNTFDKFMGGTIYVIKGIIICMLMVELLSSSFLLRYPFDKQGLYQKIDETVSSIID